MTNNLEQGAMPNLFVVGAAKSGTTSLYHYLDQHPEVYMSPVKEPHWFSRVEPNPDQLVDAVTSEEQYLGLFRGRREEPVVGEASPSYLWDVAAPRRIQEAVPQARIVVVLRHPVDRAYSHYAMDVADGKQTLPFMEALRRDLQSENKGWGVSHLYVELGFYAEQLRRYLGVFTSTQVKVLFYEDLQESPEGFLASLLNFIGVDSNHAAAIDTGRRYKEHLAPRNRWTKRVLRSPRSRSLGKVLVPRSTRNWVRDNLLLGKGAKPAIDPNARQFLMALYRPSIGELQEITGRNLEHWLD